MRVWFQAKKKSISTSTRPEAEKQYKAIKEREEEEKKNNPEKEEDQKTADNEEDKKTADKEETIVTTKEEAKEEEAKEKHISFQTSEFDQVLQNLEKIEIDKLILSIKEKTNLLLKVALPRVWDQDDRNDEYLMLDPESGENQLDMDTKTSDLGKKLRSFKKIQSCKGTIKTYDEIDSKEIFNSSGSSILAYLQCSITESQVQEKMEERYIKALNRY
jgi:hypothetical protein